MSRSRHLSGVRSTQPGRVSEGGGRWVRAILPLLVLMSLSGLIGACGISGESARQSTRGRQLFAANCALCHGRNGEGKAGLGTSLQTTGFVAAQSDAELVEFLKVGRRADHPRNHTGIDMPPRGGNPGLTDADLGAIVVHLRALGRPPGSGE